MRFYTGLILLVCAGWLRAQSADDPEIARAQARIEKLRGMVEAGIAPRAQLEKAESAVADAEDSAYLRRTLYGKDLTEAGADEMIAAARRRLERREKALEDASKLVAAGAASQLSLQPFSQEVDMAQKEFKLAESRAGVTRELAAMARTEEALHAKMQQAPAEAKAIAERFDGDGVFTMGTFARVEQAFEHRFGKQLPVSAMGETAVHRSLGFDHRGRVDVALFPDSPEGAWLRQYLTENRIPFFAFRQAVPGSATGAHIHIGPMSTRLANGG